MDKVRVRHKKTGSTGHISYKSGKWVFVCWDGWNTGVPVNPEYLEVIEEGEDGSQKGKGD